MGVMVPRGVPRTLQLRGIVDVCTAIDEMTPDDAGQIVTGGGGGREPDGAVFVENGRVCWAGARGLGRRLSTLLAESAGLDGRKMEELFLTCRRERVPLGEYMVGRGLVRGDMLRAALLQHSVESLRLLCCEGMRASWIPRPGGYHPSFTFSTAEVLAAVLAFGEAARTHALRAELDDAFREGEWAVAYLRSRNAAPDPVALYGGVPAAASTLLRVGKWAASALDVASAFEDEDAFLATMTARAALVVWRHEGAIIVGETSKFGPARIMNRRSRLRARGEPQHGRF
jgi:hypothetical protein